MKIEETILIEKFLEGSITDNESQVLLEKLKSNEIQINEVLELIKMHSLFYAEFHKDKHSEKLIEIFNRAISGKKPGLSDRVLSRIDKKKKNKNQWVLAAILAFSLLVISILSAKRYFASPVSAPDIVAVNSDKLIHNDTSNMQTHLLPDGSIIELFPQSAFQIKNSQVVLEKGKLLATIKKQATFLNFISGESVCKIIGTKFLLTTGIQKNKPTSELIVIEGLVEMFAFNKKEMVKKNQKCIATGYDEQLILNDLSKNDDIKKNLNPKIIYYSQFENKKLDCFWEYWEYNESQELGSSKKFNLSVKGESSSAFINSKIFKTYYQNVGYRIEILPTLIEDGMDISLTFSKNGVPYHQDGFNISKANDMFAVISYQVKDGVRKESNKTNLKTIPNNFKFAGTISHDISKTTPTGKVKATSEEIESNEFIFSKEPTSIENVSIRLEVKSIGNGEGKVAILNAAIERISDISPK